MLFCLIFFFIISTISLLAMCIHEKFTVDRQTIAMGPNTSEMPLQITVRCLARQKWRIAGGSSQIFISIIAMVSCRYISLHTCMALARRIQDCRAVWNQWNGLLEWPFYRDQFDPLKSISSGVCFEVLRPILGQQFSFMVSQNDFWHFFKSKKGCFTDVFDYRTKIIKIIVFIAV